MIRLAIVFSFSKGYRLPLGFAVMVACLVVWYASGFVWVEGSGKFGGVGVGLMRSEVGVGGRESSENFRDTSTGRKGLELRRESGRQFLQNLQWVSGVALGVMGMVILLSSL